jgi:hypothetical protein
MGESLAVLAFRADPLKGSSLSVVTRHHRRRMGPEEATGIVALGEHRVVADYAVGTVRDQGRLGAAVGIIATASRKLQGLLDPGEERPEADPRPRCGRRKCPQPNVRQPVGIRFCAYCGRDLQGVAAGPEPVAVPAEDVSDGPSEGPRSFESAGSLKQDDEPEPAKEGPAEESSAEFDGHRRNKWVDRGPPTRSVIVTAPTMHEAATRGLRDARAMFSSLDVRSVNEIERMPDARWKVTVLVG